MAINKIDEIFEPKTFCETFPDIIDRNQKDRKLTKENKYDTIIEYVKNVKKGIEINHYTKLLHHVLNSILEFDNK